MSIPDQYEKDVLPTSAGDLGITFLGHGSLLFDFNGLVIYLDPFSQVGDYAKLPPADAILITHEHRDHLDPQALAGIRTDRTVVVLTEACKSQVKGGLVMHNGEQSTALGIPVAAVPAYNLLHRRENGEPFHPKGAGNGYILTFGDRRVYVAGDTENIPEMKALQDISVAFLPVNLPYTMTPEMAAEAAQAFKPKILYPYHFGATDTALLVELLSDAPEIEVRVRKMA
jgi:L-ascorbate metabolism protein UlaG (beta-lactamase superfamily)